MATRRPDVPLTPDAVSAGLIISALFCNCTIIHFCWQLCSVSTCWLAKCFSPLSNYFLVALFLCAAGHFEQMRIWTVCTAPLPRLIHSPLSLSHKRQHNMRHKPRYSISIRFTRAPIASGPHVINAFSTILSHLQTTIIFVCLRSPFVLPFYIARLI